MTEYRSYRIIDGKAKWVIVDSNGKIINKNPNNQELISIQEETYKFRTGIYNSTNTCDICGDKLVPHVNAFREHDKKGKLTGRWLCNSCLNRFDPTSYNNRMKIFTDRRIGNLDPNCTSAKGDMFEELTCRWRGIKNLNVETDSYRSPIDHSRDPELGIVQTKGRLYDLISRNWTANWKSEHYKEFDNLIFYCASEDGKYIERIYVFPKEEVIKRKSIAIYKYDYKGELYISGWYEKYRIKDNKAIAKVNKIWKEIIKEKGRKG